MLENAYLVAKIGADTAENEQTVAEILPKIGNVHPRGHLLAAAGGEPGAAGAARGALRVRAPTTAVRSSLTSIGLESRKYQYRVAVLQARSSAPKFRTTL